MKPTLNLFFDFEFTSLSPDAQPISLGIVSDDTNTINISKFDLHPETLKRLCKKEYVPEFLTIKNVSSRDAGLPFFAEFEIPENKLDNSGYPCYNVRCGVLLNKPINHFIIESKSFYSEFSDFDLNRCDDWVKENVVKKLRFNNKIWGKNAFEESHTEMGSWHGSGPTKSVRTMLNKWLSQFSDYNIQFVGDCSTFDWYHLLQLIGEWEVKGIMLDYCPTCNYDGSYPVEEKYKVGLPHLPGNISPIPQDLNDLIALKKGISAREAFEVDREELACDAENSMMKEKKVESFRYMSGVEWGNEGLNTPHNSLWDARVIKVIYNKLK